MAKKITCDNLQAYIQKKIEEYESLGPEGTYKLVKKLNEEAMQNNGELPTRHDIHKESTMSMRSVQAHLNALVEAGRIGRIKNAYKRNGAYYIKGE